MVTICFSVGSGTGPETLAPVRFAVATILSAALGEALRIAVRIAELTPLLVYAEPILVPVTLRVRDGNGCVYTVSTEIQEELRLRCLSPAYECWRGQPMIQASVRLAGRPCPCDCTRCDVPLEVCIEGYLIAPCAVGRPEPSCCPRPLPWYPEPIYDPYS